MLKLLLILITLIPILSVAEIHIPERIPPLAAIAQGEPIIDADIDEKGYHVAKIHDDGVYWITDNNYHSLAIVRPQGIIVVDAPEPMPFFPPTPVLTALEEVAPGVPVTHLIYTHAHTDHIGGAGAIKEKYPRVKILAHQDTKKILKRAKDPKRPEPNRKFKRDVSVRIHGVNIELSTFRDAHMKGNVFVLLPDQKVLMAVDLVYPGYVPFRRMGVAENFVDWYEGTKYLLTKDFDIFVAGHGLRLGTREDIELQIEYVDDIRNVVDSMVMDINKLNETVDLIDEQHGPYSSFTHQAKWTLFGGYLDVIAQACREELDKKYIEGENSGDNSKALAGAETFNFANCESYFVARRLGVDK